MPLKAGKLDLLELVWAAGFFDGEGCTCIGGQWNRYKALHIRMPQVELSVLERFQRAVGGLGKIHGPYAVKGFDNYQRKQRWLYQAQSFEHAQAIIGLLWKFLSEPKRLQAARCMREVKLSYAA